MSGNGKDFPPSRALGNMVEMPVDCGQHVIYYPGFLALQAIYERKFYVFETACECGIGYIVATQDTGAHLRMSGPIDLISREYEAIPWPEYRYVDANGIFFYKWAPSLEELVTYFEKRAEAAP